MRRLLHRLADVLFGKPVLDGNGHRPHLSPEEFRRIAAEQDRRRQRIEAEAELWGKPL